MKVIWRLVSPAPGYDGPATWAVQCRSISLSRDTIDVALNGQIPLIHDAFVENNRLILWQLLAAGVGAYCGQHAEDLESRCPGFVALLAELGYPAEIADPNQLGRSAFSYIIAGYPLTLAERRMLSDLKLVEEADHVSQGS